MDDMSHNRTWANLTFENFASSTFSNITMNGTERIINTAQSNWTSTSSFLLFIIVSGSLSNIGLLYIFCTRPSMRTAFGAYLINLTIANLLTTGLRHSIVLEQQLHPPLLNLGFCLLRGYQSWLLNAAVNWSHFLIALNRFWAVVFPVSYRHHHNIRLAMVTCLVTWLAIIIAIVPTVTVMMKRAISAAGGERRCGVHLDLLGHWGGISQVVMYNLPVAFVILVYPVIFYKSFFGHTQRRRVGVANDTSLRVSRYGTKAGNTSGGQTANPSPADAQPEARKQVVSGCCRKPRHGSTTGYVTLTLTTVTVIVGLAPSEVYFFLLAFSNIEPVAVHSTLRVLQSLTSIFDPVLIVLANPELRKLVKVRVGSCYKNLVKPV